MTITIKGTELKKNVGLVCTHCGKEHSLTDSKEGVDYAFESDGHDEWCICIGCQNECDSKGL
jgi:hypothetical protein